MYVLPNGYTPPRARSAAAIGAFALSLALAASGGAQESSGHGFLLGTPSATLSFRVGYDHANAGSDIFNDPSTTGALSLKKRDFSGPSVAADLGIRLSDRVDLMLGSAYTGSHAKSDYRDFVDNDNQPIEQTTTFVRVPITAGVRAFLTPRGRSVGHYAWIPSRVAPYVGAGGGLLWYRFKQDGDFIDFASTNQRVFSSVFQSQAWTSEAHALAGFEYTLNPNIALTAESRYTWAHAPTSADFAGYHRIDLSGLGMTAGMAVRF